MVYVPPEDWTTPIFLTDNSLKKLTRQDQLQGEGVTKMKFTRVLGLAAVAAVAAMAFIGAASASAADEIVLCKTLQTGINLCAEGDFWGTGTKIKALATKPTLKSSGFPAIECEDSTEVAETTASMGEKLGIKITSLEFGKLPTPSLGSGCTTCTGGVHVAVPLTGEIEATLTAEGKHDWFLKAGGNATLLNCFGLGISCTYTATGIKSLIDNDAGEHASAPESPVGSGKHPALGIVLVNATLSSTGGLCPSTGVWTAEYVIYTLETEVESKLVPVKGWLALYKHL